MTLTLLLPAALAALAALVVPLVIHLARKSEQRPTDFAALRWLRQRPKPRHRIRFDEWPLLAARLLLLALVALYLAEPALRGADGGRRWIAVIPGASPPVTEDADVRWLAPGFPPATAPMPAGPLPMASLLRQLDADLPPDTELTLLVPAILGGADAARPRLSRTVDWRIVGDAMAAVPPRKTTPPPMLAVHAGGAAGLRYVRAAAAAWTAPGTPPAIAGASPLPPLVATLVWFAPGPMPPPVLRWIEQGGTALVSAGTQLPAATPVWRDTTGIPMAEQAGRGRGRVIRFTRPLTPASMPDLLEPDFPVRLRALLDPSPLPPTRVRAADYRPLTGVEPYARPADDLRPWLAVVIAVLLLGERWLATRRRRGIAP